MQIIVVRCLHLAFLHLYNTALDSITSGGIPSCVRDEAVADGFTCAGMLDVINVPLSRASRVVTSTNCFNPSDMADIESIRMKVAAMETSIENNVQNATHAFKTNTMLNNPPSYTFSLHASHIVNKLLDIAKCAWQQENWSGVSGPLEAITGGVDSLSIRMIEHWQYDVGSGLFDPIHYDMDSVLTIVVMLSDRGGYDGGDFQTNESNGEMLVHPLQQGDAICFLSHKYHCISAITSGVRKTLVMELWQGGIGHRGRGD